MTQTTTTDRQHSHPPREGGDQTEVRLRDLRHTPTGFVAFVTSLGAFGAIGAAITLGRLDAAGVLLAVALGTLVYADRELREVAA